MHAISVTIGRDRGPRSTVAPLQPLPDQEWQQFRAGALAAMGELPGRETEIREGRTVWDGREEWCLTVSRTWCTATPEQLNRLRATLAELATEADQDAVVLHVERRELITA